MWSPWASEPDNPVDPVFMTLVWKLLVKEKAIPGGFPELGKEPEGVMAQGFGCAIPIVMSSRVELEKERRLDVEDEETRLTAANFAELSGRPEMTENRLKTGQNRFLLHRTYANEARDEKRWGVF